MSVVGVDLGTLNTVIAVARNRGVDVVRIYRFVAFIWSMLTLNRPRLPMKSPNARRRKFFSWLPRRRAEPH